MLSMDSSRIIFQKPGEREKMEGVFGDELDAKIDSKDTHVAGRSEPMSLQGMNMGVTVGLLSSQGNQDLGTTP